MSKSAKGRHPNSLANLAKRKKFEVGNTASSNRRSFDRNFVEILKSEITEDVAASIVKKLISMARHGNIKAIDLILERLHGKVPIVQVNQPPTRTSITINHSVVGHDDAQVVKSDSIEGQNII
jgi:hypothetical protein